MVVGYPPDEDHRCPQISIDHADGPCSTPSDLRNLWTSARICGFPLPQKVAFLHWLQLQAALGTRTSRAGHPWLVAVDLSARSIASVVLYEEAIVGEAPHERAADGLGQLGLA